MNATDFRKKFPVFNNVSDDVIELWKEVASEYLKPSFALNEKRFSIALDLMTAHLLHCNNYPQGVSENVGTTSATGLVTSASEGSVSVSFTPPPTKDAWDHWLALSPYGVQLWALLQQLAAGGLYIGGLPERKAVRKVGGVFV
ncbi:DUF4054 domain-containing protein [Actinobacillus seminis]|uniref:DUF4054 domain-containing protein n=1 Tax=Actinobacillus seminis TaxID=722 RepID=UPI003B937F8F